MGLRHGNFHATLAYNDEATLEERNEPMRTYPRTLLCCALLLSAAATVPAAAQWSNVQATISPFPVNTATPVEITVTGDGPCAVLAGVVVTSDRVRLQIDQCPESPPLDTFEILTMVGPLEFGPQTLQVEIVGGGVVLNQPFWVVRDFFDDVRFDPVAPRAGVPLAVTLTGSVECPIPQSVAVEGNEIRIGFDWGCPFIPTPAEDFEEAFDLGVLAAGDYVLDVYWEAGNQVLRRVPFTVAQPDACVASDEVMCLTEDRFQISVLFATPQGDSGRGQAVKLTDDSGYFWFFDDANVEVVIKVLDACFGSAPRFWVFAAGLTNVETEITVTDTDTGAVKVYTNPLNTPFQPIQDTNAFNTCP